MDSDEFSDVLRNIKHDCAEDQLLKISLEIIKRRLAELKPGLVQNKGEAAYQPNRRLSVGTVTNSDEQVNKSDCERRHDNYCINLILTLVCLL